MHSSIPEVASSLLDCQQQAAQLSVERWVSKGSETLSSPKKAFSGSLTCPVFKEASHCPQRTRQEQLHMNKS